MKRRRQTIYPLAAVVAGLVALALGLLWFGPQPGGLNEQLVGTWSAQRELEAGRRRFIRFDPDHTGAIWDVVSSNGEVVDLGSFRWSLDGTQLTFFLDDPSIAFLSSVLLHGEEPLRTGIASLSEDHLVLHEGTVSFEFIRTE